MDTEQLITILDSAAVAHEWFQSLTIKDMRQAHDALTAIAESGMTLDLVAITATQLENALPQTARPDQALSYLAKFATLSRSPIALGSLWERDHAALPTLLVMFSASTQIAELLMQDPEGYDLLRMTDGQPVDRNILIDEIRSEVLSLTGDPDISEQLERIRNRELLRIAYGDLVMNQTPDVVANQASILCEALLHSVVELASLKAIKKHQLDAQDAAGLNFSLIALGDLAGSQLSYGTTLNVFLIFQSVSGKKELHEPFYQMLLNDAVNFLTLASGIRLLDINFSFPLSPQTSTTVTHINDAIRFLDFSGRTWQRQELINARTIAGDLRLGHRFLQHMEKWIYRRYLNRADITGIKAQKRRLHRWEECDQRDVVNSPGGIREINFVIPFLQLINGGNFSDIRVRGTLPAIYQLHKARLLSQEESNVLRDSYLSLKRIHHRLQTLKDVTATAIPQDQTQLAALAQSLGYEGAAAVETLQNDTTHLLNVSQQIIDRLLESSFDDEQEAEPEVDLILNPEPSEEMLREVLAKHNFKDVHACYQYLMDLATERIPFLSTRRCRHFLAMIAPRLLESIAQTPDPDRTLANLSTVSDSLGGKGVLWELFQVNPATLNLSVKLCSNSPYLITILTSYPGMIDELLDCLILDQLPTKQSLQKVMSALVKGAQIEGQELIDVILAFKHAQHLRVGVREILGKDSLVDSHRALSDIIEICLQEISNEHYRQLVEKHGQPIIEGGSLHGENATPILVGLGKLGGREPNFHSDVDVIFLYEGEGNTQPIKRDHKIRPTSNHHFFNEWAKRVLQTATRTRPHGRLFDMDSKLRATHQHAPLAISLDDYETYLKGDRIPLWQSMGLCKARVLFGTDTAKSRIQTLIVKTIAASNQKPRLKSEIYQARLDSEQGATDRNLKRFQGGTMDIEYIVQMLQLLNGTAEDIQQPGTLLALQKLQEHGLLNEDDTTALSKSYLFLRRVESGLRLMDTTHRHDLPEHPLELEKLASLLGYESPQSLVTVCRRYRRDNRQRFEKIFNR